MRAPIALLLLAMLAGAGGVFAQKENAVINCVGDSITEAVQLFDEEDKGGFAGMRLQSRLRQGGLKGARVQNFGVGGEDSFEIAARFGAAIPGADVIVLLAGTNDVDDIILGQYLLSDTIANLDFMLDVAERNGVETVVGTIPPRRPDARRDRGNATTYEVVLEIRQMAHLQRRAVADFWHLFPYDELSTFALYYYSGDDGIGHPNAAGFDRMAELLAGVILEGDNQSPVEGRLRQPLGVSRVNADTDYEVELYDFDTGIQLSSATLVINGEPVETMVTGSPRKAVLFAPGDGRGRCKVLLGLRASDRAEPPNELDFRLLRFSTPRKLISGDANGDCRVDGRDLALLGPVFGKVRTDAGFDEEVDFVANGAIDGDDLARLAANFGRGQLAGGGQGE